MYARTTAPIRTALQAEGMLRIEDILGSELDALMYIIGTGNDMGTLYLNRGNRNRLCAFQG